MRARVITSLAPSLALVLVALVAAPHVVHAQAPDQTGELADVWARDIVDRQQDVEVPLRYLIAPGAALLGGFFLSMPAWTELTPATDVAFVAGGAAMVTSAVGIWATPDTYDAFRFYAATASLGFTALGVGLLAHCAGRDGDCPDRPFPRHFGTAVGIIQTGMFLTSFLLWTLSPPPSPQSLSLSLRGLAPERRHARVLSFLKERERIRRLGAYLALPWGLALGGSFIAFAPEVSPADTRAALYVLGAVMLGLAGGSFTYELLHTPDSERFAAGERPGD